MQLREALGGSIQQLGMRLEQHAYLICRLRLPFVMKHRDDPRQDVRTGNEPFVHERLGYGAGLLERAERAPDQCRSG